MKSSKDPVEFEHTKGKPQKTLQNRRMTSTRLGRQLSPDEEGEETEAAVKKQIRLNKQQDISTLRDDLRIAAQSEETGTDTVAQIEAQGEVIVGKTAEKGTYEESRMKGEQKKESRGSVVDELVALWTISNP